MSQFVNSAPLKLQAARRLLPLVLVLALTVLSSLTTACTPSQARTVDERTFLDLSLTFLGEYQLPKMMFKDTPVGGLSGLAYDSRGMSDTTPGAYRVLALSDDRSQLAPARFYTLGLLLNRTETGEVGLETVEVEAVTVLLDENGEPFTSGSLDPEGIALSSKGTVFIASEGVPSRGVAPFIREFDLKTGQPQQSLRIPTRFLPTEGTKQDELPRGVQENLGFESLTLEPTSAAIASGDPYRLFTATESALLQDRPPLASQEATRIRLLHYLIGAIAPPLLVSEHLYLLDQAPKEAIANGLTELVTVDPGGHFLSLERIYSPLGVSAKIYQFATGGATDTSSIPSLQGNIDSIAPVKKKLLLDLNTLGIYLDNLEGMTLGPHLPDGTQSLLVVSDDNFNETQITQFLLFSLKGLR